MVAFIENQNDRAGGKKMHVFCGSFEASQSTCKTRNTGLALETMALVVSFSEAFELHHVVEKGAIYAAGIIDPYPISNADQHNVQSCYGRLIPQQRCVPKFTS